MDPIATIREFTTTTRNDHDRRNELAEAYQNWLDRRGFLPRVRHVNDGPDGHTYAVTGLYARGVHTYLLCAGVEAPLLASQYEVVTDDDTDHDPIPCGHCGRKFEDIESLQWHYDTTHYPREE